MLKLAGKVGSHRVFRSQERQKTKEDDTSPGSTEWRPYSLCRVTPLFGRRRPKGERALGLSIAGSVS
jgi:hypothetical protein